MTSGKITFIGLGLYDEKDISLKALEEIKKSDKVYAEFYTAKLMGTNFEKIVHTINKKINVLDREEVEDGKKIIEDAENKNIAFLTAGDSMTATTHVDLHIRAIKKDIETKVIHGSSIETAVPGLLGLQNYKFGRSTTLVYPQKNYFPMSPYKVISKNKEMDLHTLVLLDIQADKQKFMTADEALDLLLRMEEKEKKGLIEPDSVLCVVARAGSDEPMVRADALKNLQKMDFGSPLHTLVVPGDLHFMEIDALEVLAGLPAQLSEKLQKP
ncbi:MAG: diphthine synthase [Candidatus Thermoplasmatota archaeon]